MTQHPEANRPCFLVHAEQQPWCPVCKQYRENPHYRNAPLPVMGPVKPREDRSKPCRHLGAATGERVQCPTCAGNVEIKLMTCEKHGTCTRGKPLQGVRCCADCGDYRPGEPAA